MEKPHTPNHSHGATDTTPAFTLLPGAAARRHPRDLAPSARCRRGGHRREVARTQQGWSSASRGDPPGAPWTGGPGPSPPRVPGGAGAWTCPPRSDGAAPGEGAAGPVPLPSSPPALSHAIP